jgi:hypothetical protein
MTLVLELVIAVTLAQTPQPAQIRPPQPAAPTARLAGRVTVEGTNAPLADARVVLVFAPRRMPQRPMFPIGPPPQAVTDQDGRFAFPHLRPGEYRVELQRTGYATLDEAGQGHTIEIADGQAIDNLELHMQKGAVIAGRILGPSGEPQAGVAVMALRRMDGPQMAPRLIPAPMQGMQGMPQTNDLGEFRLAGLPPGEYFVSASPNMQSAFGGPGVAAPAPGQSRTAVTTTYYPGTTDQAAAQPVAVARGAEVGNISFMLQSVPVFRISGVVVDEEGKPVAGAFVMLMGDPRSGMFMGPGGSRAPSGKDGRFTIDNVVAGSYHATATVPITMTSSGGGVMTWSSSGGSTAASVGPVERQGVVTGGVVAGGGAVVGSGAVASGTPVAIGGYGYMNQPTEVVVSDADVAGVRVVVRKP